LGEKSRKVSAPSWLGYQGGEGVTRKLRKVVRQSSVSSIRKKGSQRLYSNKSTWKSAI